MRMALRLAAAATAFVGLVIWLFGGPNLGRSRTFLVRETANPLTGALEEVVERTFLPGVDFLAGVGVVSLVLLAISLAVGGGVRRPQRCR